MITTTALCVLLATGAGNGDSAYAAEQKQQRSLVDIAKRVSEYAQCDDLRLREKAKCLREFGGKAVKVGAGTALFLYGTQSAMKDQGARFASLNKELKTLKDLKLAELEDPAKAGDAKHQEKSLTHAVRAFRAAKPHLKSLGADIAAADRLMGAETDSLVALSMLTVMLGDHYAESKPLPEGTKPTKPAKPLIDWDKELKELGEAFDQMNAGFEQMNRGLKQMNAGVAQVNKGLEQANKGIAQANRGMDEMNAGIAQANRGMDRANKAVPGIKKGAEKLGEVSDIDYSGIGDTWGSGSTGLDNAEQRRWMSLLLDLIPGIGDGKGIIEAVTGQDLATGEKLNGTDRLLGSLVVLRWLKVGGKVLRAEDVRDARKGKGAAACVPDNSFVPGTPVLLADGTRTPIEEVRVGDQVLATDPQSGRTESAPVTALISSEGTKQLVRITIDTGGDQERHTSSLTATGRHPLWTERPGRWTDAADLRAGMWLRTSAGTLAQITGVKAWTAPRQQVHNLTVAGLHTYYVLAGDSPVLVHNAKKNKCGLIVDHVGQVDQDWVTKGAHVNMKDGMEVAIRPDGKGGIKGEAIRLKNGTATQKQVDAVIASIKSNPKLRADMIRVTKSAKEVFESSAKAMKEGRNPQWRFSNDRTAELQALINAMEKM
ncbi:pre-toxin TG domain-containing protein [Streptomyces gobiensis]|uniref:pre-toxin TG domain-containing protein n=1 Tax=Streptomyces gobiensis TaxID=2875706 RepID=UPI001E3AC701|nr:polymorphic toxin-type HINT domain-containing protein [Streptomyces gobiensis]UGY92782.1 pre-toxin TG domain-containing protein [Streptomyces gobiensis]